MTQPPGPAAAALRTKGKVHKLTKSVISCLFPFFLFLYFHFSSICQTILTHSFDRTASWFLILSTFIYGEDEAFSISKLIRVCALRGFQKFYKVLQKHFTEILLCRTNSILKHTSEKQISQKSTLLKWLLLFWCESTNCDLAIIFGKAMKQTKLIIFMMSSHGCHCPPTFSIAT